MLTATGEELEAGQILHQSLTASGIQAVITKGLSPVGGGSMPDVELPSMSGRSNTDER